MLIAMPRLLIATPASVDMSLVHLAARNSPLRSYLFCMNRPFLLFYSFRAYRNTARSTVHCNQIACNNPVCSRIYPFSFPPRLYHSIFAKEKIDFDESTISFGQVVLRRNNAFLISISHKNGFNFFSPFLINLRMQSKFPILRIRL